MQNHVRSIQTLHHALHITAKSHTAQHLRNTPDTTVDDAVRVATGHLEQAAAHLRAALAAIQPCLPTTTAPCACRDCSRAAELTDGLLNSR